MSLKEEWVLYVFSPDPVTELSLPPSIIKGEVISPWKRTEQVFAPCHSLGGLQLGVLSKEDAEKENSGRLTKITDLDAFPFKDGPSLAKEWVLCAFVPDTFTILNLPEGMIKGPTFNSYYRYGLGGLQLGVLSKEDAKKGSRSRIGKITELNDLPPWAKNTMALSA